MENYKNQKIKEKLGKIVDINKAKINFNTPNRSKYAKSKIFDSQKVIEKKQISKTKQTLATAIKINRTT